MKPEPTKTPDESFIDWESTAFGLGYGTGERFVLDALKRFLALCPETGGYDHEVLTADLGGAVAWLLINRLGRLDILDYGTSPRYAWLTETGKRLKRFVEAKTADQLADLVNSTTEDSVICYPDACNCGPHGYEKGRVCINPFWAS